MGSCCSRAHVRQDKQPASQLPEMALTTNQLLVNPEERSPSIAYMTSNATTNGMQAVGNVPSSEMRWGGNGGELQMAVNGMQTGMAAPGSANYYDGGTQEVPMSGATLLPSGGLALQNAPGSAGPGYNTLQRLGVNDSAAGVAVGGDGVLELHSFTSGDEESEDDGRSEVITGASNPRVVRVTGPNELTLPPPSSSPTPFAAGEPRVGAMTAFAPTSTAVTQGLIPTTSAVFRAKVSLLPSQPLRFDDDISVAETRSSAFDTPLNFDDETTASEMSSSTTTGWMGRSGVGSLHASRGTPHRLTSPGGQATQRRTSATAPSFAPGGVRDTGAVVNTPLVRQASNSVITVTSVRNNKTTPMLSSRPTTPRQFLRQESFQSSVPDLYASDDLFQSCRSLTQSELTTASGASTPFLRALRPSVTPTVVTPRGGGVTTVGKTRRAATLRASERPPLPTPQSQRGKATPDVARRGSAKAATLAPGPLATGLRAGSANILRTPISATSTNASLTPLSRFGSFQTCRSGSTASLMSTPPATRPPVIRGSGAGAGRPIAAARVVQPPTTITTAAATRAAAAGNAVGTTVAVPPLVVTRSMITTPSSPGPLDSVRTEMLQTPASPSTVASFVSPIAAAVPPTPWQDEVPTAPLQSAMSATDQEDIITIHEEPTSPVYHLDEDAMQPPASVHVVLPYVSNEEMAAALGAGRLDAFSTGTTSPSSETPEGRGSECVVLTATAENTTRAQTDGVDRSRSGNTKSATVDIVETIDMDMDEAMEAAPSTLDVPHDESRGGDGDCDERLAAVVCDERLYNTDTTDEIPLELHATGTPGTTEALFSSEADRVIAATAQSSSPPPLPSAQDGTVTSSYATLSSYSADTTGRQVTLGQPGAAAVGIHVNGDNNAVSELTAVTPPATSLAINGADEVDDDVDSAARMRAAAAAAAVATQGLDATATLTTMQTGPTSYAMWSTANDAQMQLPIRELSVQESSTTGNVLVCELSSSPSLPPAAPVLPPSPPPPPSMGELGRGANTRHTYSSVGDSSSTTHRQSQSSPQARSGKGTSSNDVNGSKASNGKKKKGKTRTSVLTTAAASRGGGTGAATGRVVQDTRPYVQPSTAASRSLRKSASSRQSGGRVSVTAASTSTNGQHSASSGARTTTMSSLSPSQSHRRSTEGPRPRWNSSNVGDTSSPGVPSATSSSRLGRGSRGGTSKPWAQSRHHNDCKSAPAPISFASLSPSFSGCARHGSDAECVKAGAVHQARHTKGRKPLLATGLPSVKAPARS